MCDASPKGDVPGFVAILDDRTLLIPDRSGNRRGDSLTNIVENPHVGMLFMIPGMDETLRVNGSAQIVCEPALLERLAARTGGRQITNPAEAFDRANRVEGEKPTPIWWWFALGALLLVPLDVAVRRITFGRRPASTAPSSR